MHSHMHTHNPACMTGMHAHTQRRMQTHGRMHTRNTGRRPCTHGRPDACTHTDADRMPLPRTHANARPRTAMAPGISAPRCRPHQPPRWTTWTVHLTTSAPRSVAPSHVTSAQGRPLGRAGWATEQGPQKIRAQDLPSLHIIYNSFGLCFN
jgi:hypothetical protein